MIKILILLFNCIAVKITTSLQKPVIILGIDPGTLVMGYSVIEARNNTFTVMEIDVLKLASTLDHYKRLQKIHRRITELVEKFNPNECAIEAPFFGKNVQSMLKLGRAQGVAIAAAMQASLPVSEYSPKTVKQSITGNGNSSKEQVFKMLQRIIQLEEKPHFFDATDALAVALCHHYTTTSVISTQKKSFKGWKEFISANPGRLTS